MVIWQYPEYASRNDKRQKPNALTTRLSMLETGKATLGQARIKSVCFLYQNNVGQPVCVLYLFHKPDFGEVFDCFGGGLGLVFFLNTPSLGDLFDLWIYY